MNCLFYVPYMIFREIVGVDGGHIKYRMFTSETRVCFASLEFYLALPYTALTTIFP